MEPQQQDFNIYKGTLFTQAVGWRANNRPVGVNTYTSAMYIRLGDDPSSVLLYTLSTENGKITIVNPNSTVFQLSIPAADSANFNWTQGYYTMYVYDANMVPTAILTGLINVISMP